MNCLHLIRQWPRWQMIELYGKREHKRRFMGGCEGVDMGHDVLGRQWQTSNLRAEARLVESTMRHNSVLVLLENG